MKHFTIKELVPLEIAALPEEQLWALFDPKLLAVLDRLREDIGKPITVNNWRAGGPFMNRGYRSKYCKVGAPNSMHKQGKAVDFDVAGWSAEKTRKYILANHRKYPEIRRMETGVNWCHIDTKETGSDEITLFNQ